MNIIIKARILLLMSQILSAKIANNRKIVEEKKIYIYYHKYVHVGGLIFRKYLDVEVSI